MSAIKKFFEKRKLDVKFKKAGEGHKLTDSRSRSPHPAQSSSNAKGGPSKPAVINDDMSDEKRKAADAAIARLNLKKENESKGYTKQAMTMKAELLAEKREMEMAMAQAKKYSSNLKQVNLDSSSVVTGVYFKCPMLGIEEATTKDIMEQKIEEYLYSQLSDEPELTSAMMIYTFNKNKDTLKSCVETLNKYLTNILENPDKPNYRRIKKSNKVLNEKVLNCKGAFEFLQATGFETKTMQVNDESSEEDEFFVLDITEYNRDEVLEKLRNLQDVLQVCEPVKMELDRDLKIFTPDSFATSTNKIEVSEEFYNVTPEELKREMKIREEAIREMGMLQTKQMRERNRLKELRRYRFAAIRVKFPDNSAIQGTFRATEKFSEVRNFVCECLLSSSIPFFLSTQVGGKITEDEKTLAELDLAPASILQFSYDQEVLKEFLMQGAGSQTGNSFIKPELFSK